MATKSIDLITRSNVVGVTYRALRELFTYAATSANTDYSFTVSMLEVYNEQIKDLLGGGDDSNLEIRCGKGPRGASSIYVEGLVERKVESQEQVETVMREGQCNRHVGSNNVNEQSSRSHLVLSVKIVAKRRDRVEVREGKLNLIDLAGSERLKSTNVRSIMEMMTAPSVC
jgi:hypothetical protein